jgi:hypothetical protein
LEQQKWQREEVPTIELIMERPCERDADKIGRKNHIRNEIPTHKLSNARFL